MDWIPAEDGIRKRIEAMCARYEAVNQEGIYFYNMPVAELRGGARVVVNGREMKMFASYSYLGLIGHPRISQAAKAAIDRFGTGTHGVRTLAGSLTLHQELEEMIAFFKGTDDAITYSSGYATNLTAVSALVGRHDAVFCDKLNHASIVDGCLLSGAKFVRFRHNDMHDLEQRLAEAPKGGARLVVVDGVFSMDGDIVDLPHLVEVCRRHKAWLMIDEAHSLGVLGETGRGIEEHYRMPGVIDIKMGTLSKTVPSVGGYIAGRKDLITYLRHQSRAYIFSAALPPAQTAAALEAFRVIADEPWRVQAVQRNAAHFIRSVRAQGLDTLRTETAIVPVLCGTDDRAFRMTSEAHKRDIFVLPVVSPAVPEGLARLRATVTAAHEPEEIETAANVFAEAGRTVGIL
jgi:glycine C-acetyltransferase